MQKGVPQRELLFLFLKRATLNQTSGIKQRKPLIIKQYSKESSTTWTWIIKK